MVRICSGGAYGYFFMMQYDVAGPAIGHYVQRLAFEIARARIFGG